MRGEKVFYDCKISERQEQEIGRLSRLVRLLKSDWACVGDEKWELRDDKKKLKAT